MFNKELLLTQGKTTATLRIHGLAKWTYNGDEYVSSSTGMWVHPSVSDQSNSDHYTIFADGGNSSSYKEVPFDFNIILPIGVWVILNSSDDSSLIAYSGGLMFTEWQVNPSLPPSIGSWPESQSMYFELKDDADIEMISRSRP